jgi:acyl-CoA thioester hydrolase
MAPVWFEGARDPVFRMFMPDLSLEHWRLILAKIDISFHAEMFYGKPIEIRTYIGRIGGSSFDVYQELWQDGVNTCSGIAVMVHFDTVNKKSEPIPDDIRDQLSEHIYEDLAANSNTGLR